MLEDKNRRRHGRRGPVWVAPLALRFAEEGARVVCADIDLERRQGDRAPDRGRRAVTARRSSADVSDGGRRRG